LSCSPGSVSGYLEAAKRKIKEENEGKETRTRNQSQRPWVVDRYQFKEDEIVTWSGCAPISMSSTSPASAHAVPPVISMMSIPRGRPMASCSPFSSKRTPPDPDRNYDSNIFVVAADTATKARTSPRSPPALA